MRIHKDKTPIRIHYIVEWADKRDLKQSEIAEKLDVDKSTVSRWFAGQVPTDKHLVALSGLFELEQPSDLFRHPDDDWLARFFRERSEADRERAITLLELAFPADARKAKTR